jgi:hypothetical protein
MQGIAAKALIATIGIAYAASLVGFPLYERYFRGSYADAARQILDRIGDAPIYGTDVSSLGLSIVANLNVLRAPEPPIGSPPQDFASGYVLAMEPDESIGPVELAFGVGRNARGGRTRYLLCRGDACTQSRSVQPAAELERPAAPFHIVGARMALAGTAGGGAVRPALEAT